MKIRKHVTDDLARKFVFLYNSGESSCSIAKKFDVDPKTVLCHLRAAGVKPRSKSDAIKLGLAKGRVKRIATPHSLSPHFKVLTCEKAYILGVLAGDGWLDYSPKVGRCQIKLETVDEEFAAEFQRCINVVYGSKPSMRKLTERHPGWSDKYYVRLCCKAACEDLLRYGVSFKHDKWRVPLEIRNASLDIQAAYLRGFFDSEGSVEKDGRRINGTSSNLPGLEDISALLRNLGIRSKIIYRPSGNIHNVRIQDRASVELFAEHVGFTIARKKNKLQEGITSYKRWITPSEEAVKLEPEMRRLRSLNLTYEETAKRVGLGTATVWKYLNQTKNNADEH